MTDNKQMTEKELQAEQIKSLVAGAPAKKKGLLGRVGDTALSALSSAIAVPEIAVGLADIPTGGRVGKFLENEDGMIGFRPKQAKEAIADWHTEGYQDQLRNFAETEGFGGKLGYAVKNPALIANTVVESLAPMLAGGVASRGIGLAAKGLSPVAAGALGEGTVGMGLAAESIRQQTEDGLLTPKQAALATATGVTTAGFGYAGGRLAKELGIGDFETIMAGGGRTANPAANIAGSAAANAAKDKNIFRRAAEGALSEGVFEELPQSVSETILQNEALGTQGEGVADAAALGLLSGGLMGAGAGAFARNRRPDERITPTEDMGQELPNYGGSNNPKDPNFNPAGLLENKSAPQLGFQGRESNQFNAGPNGEVFTGDQYNEYLAGQQERARNERDAGQQSRNFDDVTQVPQGYNQFGQDPLLPAPNDYTVTPDGTVQSSADVNTTLQNERQARIENRDRRARGEVLDRTGTFNENGFGDFGNSEQVQAERLGLPAPESTDFTTDMDGQVYGRNDINEKLNQEREQAAARRDRIARGEILDRTPIPKLSEQMGLDANKGSLSSAAVLAVDSGASGVEGDNQVAAQEPQMSAWQSGMTDRLANADPNSEVYGRLSQAIANEPTSAPEKARLMREADELPRAEVAVNQIKPNTRVLDEAKAQTRAYTPDSEEVRAQWDVVDASELVTSNTDDFVINPNYPASRQPRDRKRGTYIAQVNEIINKFKPALLGESAVASAGSPFVGATDNVVDSGNGRTIALRKIYKENGEKAQAYRQFVNEQAERFGLDTSQINFMQSPVLVRRNTSDVNRDDFALAVNEPIAAEMSSTEKAASDARKLPDASLLAFSGESGNINLYRSHAYIKKFIGNLSKNEQTNMMDEDGELSQAGKNRIEAAIIQDAYNNSKLVSAVSEKLDKNTANVLRAITDKAPQISQLNNDAKNGVVHSNTLGRDIADATQVYMNLKNSDKNIDDYLNQDSLLGDGLTDDAKDILKMLSDNKMSAKAIGEDLQNRLNAITGKGNPKQGGLSFDDEVETTTPNVMSDAPKATQLTDDSPTVNIPAPQPAPKTTADAMEQAESLDVSDKQMIRALQTDNSKVDYKAKLNLSPEQDLGMLIMSSGRVFDDTVVKSTGVKTVTIESTVDGKRSKHIYPYETISSAIDNAKSYKEKQAAAKGKDLPTNPSAMDITKGKDGEPKYFFDKDKADKFVADKGISDTHEVVAGVRPKSFEIQPKTTNTKADRADKAVTAKTEKELLPLDHGILSIPNRTKNINRDLDKYKAEQAKIEKRQREDARFLANERELARKPVYEQATALYKLHGKVLRAHLKGKMYGTGNTPAEWLKIQIKVNPERFITMAEQIISEDAAKNKPQEPVVESETVAASPIKPPQSPVAKSETLDTPTADAAKEKEIKDRFANNTFFDSDTVAAARARIKSKMGRLNSGIDPEMLTDGAILAGAYIESGVRKFGEYAKLMTDDLGKNITPYLLSFWNGARDYPNFDSTDMTNEADSRAQFNQLMIEYKAPKETVAESESETIAEANKSIDGKVYKTQTAAKGVITKQGLDRRRVAIEKIGSSYQLIDNPLELSFIEGVVDFHVKKMAEEYPSQEFSIAQRNYKFGEKVKKDTNATLEEMQAVGFMPTDAKKAFNKIVGRTDIEPKPATSNRDLPVPVGGWQTQVNGNDYRTNEDGITIARGERVVHIRGANSITASNKAKSLVDSEIRDLHYVAAKEYASDNMSDGTIWLDNEGYMIRKKGNKTPKGPLLDVLIRPTDAPIEKPVTQTEPKPKPAATAKPAAEIEDFGEKITGARKDMDSFYQKEMTDDDIANQPLSKIWAKKDIDAIEDVETAALATALRESLPPKPRKGYKLRSWVSAIKTHRELMQDMMSGELSANDFIEKTAKSDIDAMANIANHAKLLSQLDRENWSRVKSVDSRIGWSNRLPDGSYTPDMSFEVVIDKLRHRIVTDNKDIAETVDKVNQLLEGEVTTPTLKFDVYGRGRGNSKSYFISQANDKDKTPLIEFNDLESARAFNRDNNADLLELWDQHKDKVNVRKSDMRSNANRDRIGTDHRGGLDVTTEQFMAKFGLRGGQFGNWVKQGANSKDRQNMLNEAYDAFMDLAGVLNIPSEAIGLGGKLAMSFGARGKGKASAHYEPSQVIINLTKTKGAGSLAHEWFHALDNHFTSFRDDPKRDTSKESAFITYKPEPMLVLKDKNGNPTRMRPITEARRKQIYDKNGYEAYAPENFMPDPNHKEGVRPKVEVAFADLVETLDESPMKGRAITIDKGATDGYWSRIIERAARAFEGYVIHKLEQKGARSDFLANITPEDSFPRNMDRYPYLLQSEIAPVAEAFDNLFATIDSKASEDGNGKTLFSRASQMNQAMNNVKAGAMGSTQTTREQVITKLSERFGKETIESLIDKGLLDIKVLSDFVVDGKLTIPSDVDGLYQNGKATLIADNLSDDMIIPTFLHELGGHGGMQTLMSDKAYAALMRDFDALVASGDPLAVEAKAMADKVARNEQDALDEYLPYLVTLAARAKGKQGKVAGMINRMAMAIRTWLRDTFGINLKVNSQDILGIAERMVNEVEQAANSSSQQAAPQFSGMNVPSKQLDDVRAEYEGTDEWMKAPNGEDTNLNEKQWLQVRTPSFKKWFGDWEGSPETASKVVDDNGEPMVVYHGSKKRFNTFNEGLQLNGWLSKGFYFTNNKESSKEFGKSNTAAFLNNRNPFRVVGEDSSAFISEVKKSYIADGQDVPINLRPTLESNGHDGVFIKHWDFGEIFTSFNSNQIKSATNNAGTFDANNDDIRYSKASDGMKFSRAAGMNDQFDPRNIAKETATRFYDWISSAPPGKLSWWHKTIGTMYNLAQRNPYFKPVFEATEKFINDVSFYASKASELAPKLLPQLDSLRDITKSAIDAKDNEALSKPIFEGTLLWGRDLDGKAVLVEDWRKKVMAASKQDRLQMLKDTNNITPAQEAQLATLNNIQANRFINNLLDEEIVKAGLVWKDSELRAKFNLNDQQIELYREFRSATDNSLDSLTRSDMLRRLGKDAAAIETQVMEAGTLGEAVFNIEQHINDLIQASPKKENALKNTLKDIKQSAGRTNKLIDNGYAPLSRFGQYTVDVVDADGNREYFGMFESAYDARKMTEEMKALYNDPTTHTVTQGALSNEEFKMFAGVTPETAELFGEMLGLDATGDKAADEAFQEYLRRTKNNRSTMKRLIHRKGIKGYSEDVGRVLASFIYSNARHTSAALNMGNLDRSIADIPKGEGQLKDAAVKLAQYIKNPQEEGQLIRGWMFAQYLGGSIASAVVNLTQPIAVSFPYLSQFGGAVKAAAQLKQSSSDWAKSLKNRNNDHFEADLQKAIERAEADGTLSPQEVHNLLKQASGKNPLRAGDGTKIGNAKALAGNSLSRVSLAWGSLFSLAEQVNRRVTFVAAYRMAKEQGMDNPAKFATNSIKETQFVYNKASRMNWGRGAVGGTLMTFKTYTVSYMELMHRLWTQGDKGSEERNQGRKAVGIMIGTLFLLGGAGGLPFMEDAEDLVDGIGQIMGYNFSSKKVRQQFLDEWVGEFAGDFIDGGISSVSGSPTDVSGRLGLGNLIPGTGIFKERTSNSRDVLEIVGPAGDFVGRVATGTRDIAKGVANLDSTSLKKGALEFAPTAVRNAVKGTSMATSGIYKDTKGYKVADVSPVDAAFKFFGFQPRDISKIQEANYLGQSSTSYYNLRASSIRALWAAGVVEGNQSKVDDARDAVKDWNKKNPNQKIIIKPNDIARRVREMKMDKADRVIKLAPKSGRGTLAQELNGVRDGM